MNLCKIALNFATSENCEKVFNWAPVRSGQTMTTSRSGLKATLQRRLHGLLLEAAMAARQAEAEENGEGMDVDDATEGGDDALPGAAGEAREVMMEKRRAYKARMLDLFGYVSEWDSE